MKNTFRNGLLAVSMLLLSSPIFAQFTGSMPVVQGTPGSQVEVPILVSQMTSISAFNIGVRFNSAVLTYQSTNTAGTLMNGALFFTNLNGNQIEMVFTGNPLTATNDTIAKLVFSYNAGGGASQLIFNPTYTEFTGAGSVIVAETLTNGAVYETGTTTAVSATNGDQTACELSTATFSVTATGASSFQWQRSTDGGTTFTNLTDGAGISGATSASLSVANVNQSATGNYYHCLVTGAGGTALSIAQRLSVNAVVGVSVSVTANPAGANCEGTQVTYSATPSSSVADPIYAWSVNNVAVGSDPTFVSSSLNDGDIVSCDISSSTACVSGSGTINAEVISPPAAYSLTGGGSYCSGGSGVAVGLANSDTGVNYQLRIDGQVSGSVVAGTGAALDFGLQTAAGAYTVTAVNSSGCTTSMSGNATVSINALPNAEAGNNVTIFVGNNTQLQASGGTSYSWSPATGLSATNIPNPVASPTVTTVYYLTVGNIFNCEAVDSVVVTVNQLPVVEAGADTTLCGDLAPFNFLGSPAGGSWSGAGITNASNGTFDPSLAGAGSFTLTYTVTDGINYTVSDSLVVTVNASPQITLSPISNFCLGDVSVTLSFASPAGGTYSGPGVSNGDFDPEAAGAGIHTITYTYTDPNSGCTAADSITVEVFNLPTVSMTTLNDLCIGEAAFTISGGTPAGGTYSGAGVTNGVFDPAVAGVGSHTIIYSFTDSISGCTSSDSVTITVDDIPQINFPPFNALCLDGNALTLDMATPAGGTYSGTGVNNNVFLPQSVGAGTYLITYTYTDPNSGCTNSDTASIKVNDVPGVSMAALADICQSASPFTLSGGLPVGGTYSGTGVSNGLFDPATAGAGTHIITYSYTDTLTGCTAGASVNITVNAGPGASLMAAGATTICAGGSVTLNASPATGASYVWLLDGTVINGESGASLVATAAGDYRVFVTNDTTSCADTSAALTVTVNPLPGAAITPAAGASICAGSAALLNATPTGAYSYVWLLDGAVLTGETSASLTATAAGNYQLIVTDSATSCFDTSAVVAVVVNPLPTAGLTAAGPTTFCAGGSVVLDASPATGMSYVWLLNGTVISGETMASLTATAAGDYRVIVTDLATSCFDTSGVVAVTVNPGPAAAITPAGPTSFCIGGSVVLNANTGTGLTYSWLRDGAVVAGQTGASLTATQAGVYRVIVTNATSCFDTSAVTTVTVNALPTATITAAGATTFCAGGSVVLNANTGTGLTYSWLRDGAVVAGQTGASLTATQAGAYRVIVTNASSCFDTSAVTTVAVNALPSATITAAGATTFCAGGSVVLNANTGTGLTYSWLRNGAVVAGQTGASLTATLAGAYRVIVTNASSCFDTSAATTVTVNTLPTATITAAGATTFCTGGSVVLNANTGTGLTYSWLRNGAVVAGQTGASLTATQAGAYRVIVTNASSCFDTSAVTTVTVNALPTATITPAGPTTICDGSSVVLDANTGTGLTYSWLRNGAVVAGQTGASLTATQAGAYRVIVTNASSCFDTSAAVTITVNPRPNAPVITVSATSDTLFSSVATGNQWFRNGVAVAGGTGQSLVITQNGTYRAVVTDGNSCASDSSNALTILNVSVGEQFSLDLNLYPNPSTGRAWVTLELPSTGLLQLEVMTMTGQRVMYEQHPDAAGQMRLELDLNQLADGMYFVRLQQGSYVGMRKLMIRK